MTIEKSFVKPCFSQGVLNALLRDEKYLHALRQESIIEKVKSMRYRPNKSAELALARVGVFDVTPTIDILPLMVKGKLPEMLFELEHDRQFLTSSKNIQMNRIRVLKTNRKIKVSGSRRQRKIIKMVFMSSEVSLNEHVLTRMYQRSNFRNPSPEKLLFPPSGYLRLLYEIKDMNVFDRDSLTIRERQDVLYPYGNGAFLGSVQHCTNDPIERYDYHPKTKRIERHSLNKGMPVFVARTYINYGMMTPSQKHVCEMLSRGDVEGALVTFRKMDVYRGGVKVIPLIESELINKTISTRHNAISASDAS